MPTPAISTEKRTAIVELSSLGWKAETIAKALDVSRRTVFNVKADMAKQAQESLDARRKLADFLEAC